MAILVSDYDGTLYTDEINMRLNVEALKDFVARGNIFVLSSGRSLKSLMGRVEAYDIPFSYLSCCDGSFLFDKNLRLKSAYPISHDVIHVFAPLEDLRKHKKIEFSYPDDYSIDYCNNEVIGSVAFTLDKKKADYDFLSTLEKIKKRHPEYQYDEYAFDDEVFYLIRPHGVSKAYPIKILQEDLGVSKRDIFTIGDNTNDKELIKEYNGFRIGDNKDIVDVALKEYGAVHELISDINKRKVLRRW